MNPEYWGNGAWFTIIIIIFRLFNDVEKMKRMLYLICNSLPCDECKNHAMENLTINNILSEKNPMRILLFFICLRNEFQKSKNNINFIIDISKISGNKLTLPIKAIILEKFCLEFETSLNNEKEKDIIKIKNKINNLIINNK